MSSGVKVVNTKKFEIPTVEETRKIMKQVEDLECKKQELEKEIEALNKEVEDCEDQVSTLGDKLVVFDVKVKHGGYYNVFSAMEDAKKCVNALLDKGVDDDDIVIKVTDDFGDFEYIDSAIQSDGSLDIDNVYDEYIRCKTRVENEKAGKWWLKD